MEKREEGWRRLSIYRCIGFKKKRNVKKRWNVGGMERRVQMTAEVISVEMKMDSLDGKMKRCRSER